MPRHHGRTATTGYYDGSLKPSFPRSTAPGTGGAAPGPVERHVLLDGLRHRPALIVPANSLDDWPFNLPDYMAPCSTSRFSGPAAAIPKLIGSPAQMFSRLGPRLPQSRFCAATLRDHRRHWALNLGAIPAQESPDERRHESQDDHPVDRRPGRSVGSTARPSALTLSFATEPISPPGRRTGDPGAGGRGPSSIPGRWSWASRPRCVDPAAAKAIGPAAAGSEGLGDARTPRGRLRQQRPGVPVARAGETATHRGRQTASMGPARPTVRLAVCSLCDDRQQPLSGPSAADPDRPARWAAPHSSPPSANCMVGTHQGWPTESPLRRSAGLAWRDAVGKRLASLSRWPS